MKVVILAAGRGSRLGFVDLPKPLTPLSDTQTILGMQLESLSEFVSLDNVYVVVGYLKEKIMEAHPSLAFIYNPSFAAENTSKSLLRALKKIDDDVLWINGDVVFHSSVLQQIIDEHSTSMVVNVGRVGEEEVKYVTDGHGVITQVSKQVKNAEGEALGINLVSKRDLGAFCEALEQCENNDYFEKALEMCIQRGMQVHCVQVDANLCTEVDFPDDLQRAIGLVQQWQASE